MSDTELADLERLCAAATPGPWKWWQAEPSAANGWSGLKMIAGLPIRYVDRSPVFDAANAEFIAAARTALPALIAEVRRLRAELDEAKDELNEEVHRLNERMANDS